MYLKLTKIETIRFVLKKNTKIAVYKELNEFQRILKTSICITKLKKNLLQGIVRYERSFSGDLPDNPPVECIPQLASEL